MKVSRHFFFNLIVALLALAVVAGSASAQSIYGSIRGLVTGDRGQRQSDPYQRGHQRRTNRDHEYHR